MGDTGSAGDGDKGDKSTTPGQTQPAPIPGDSSRSSDQGTASGNDQPFYSTFSDKGLAQLAETKGWKGPEDSVRSYKELEAAFSSRGPARQVPATEADYRFETRQLPDGLAHNAEFEGVMRKVFHTAKLTNDEASALYNGYVDFASAQHQAMAGNAAKEMEARIAGAQESLEASFKAKTGSPEFARHLEMAKRAIKNLDPALEGELEKIGAIVTMNGQKMVGNATLIAALARVGEGMYAEDAVYGDKSGDTSNPFDPAKPDLERQSHLIRNDLAKAKTLIALLPKDAQRMWRHVLNK